MTAGKVNYPRRAGCIRKQYFLTWTIPRMMEERGASNINQFMCFHEVFSARRTLNNRFTRRQTIRSWSSYRNPLARTSEGYNFEWFNDRDSCRFDFHADDYRNEYFLVWPLIKDTVELTLIHRRTGTIKYYATIVTSYGHRRSYYYKLHLAQMIGERARFAGINGRAANICSSNIWIRGEQTALDLPNSLVRGCVSGISLEGTRVVQWNILFTVIQSNYANNQRVAE